MTDQIKAGLYGEEAEEASPSCEHLAALITTLCVASLVGTLGTYAMNKFIIPKAIYKLYSSRHGLGGRGITEMAENIETSVLKMNQVAGQVNAEAVQVDEKVENVKKTMLQFSAVVQKLNRQAVMDEERAGNAVHEDNMNLHA